MAVVAVPCPGCGAVLKAPDTMAGKKAKCKKCDTRFRIPGESQSGDSVGDSQMLSTLDVPPAAAPAAGAFDFGGLLDTPPEPKKPATPPKPEPAKSGARAGLPTPPKAVD